MTQKRPKITVTEQNREFVIPTLVKFGGVNIYNKKSVDLIDGSIYCISELGNAIVEENCNGLIRASLAEVDPNDYVGVKGKSKIHQKLIDTSEKSDWSENVLYDQNQHLKSELDQLKAENEKLRENQIPESLRDFISDVKWMIKCYQSQRYTMAENKRDSFIEVLDDLMRLPKEKTTDF